MLVPSLIYPRYAAFNALACGIQVVEPYFTSLNTALPLWILVDVAGREVPETRIVGSLIDDESSPVGKVGSSAKGQNVVPLRLV